MDDSSIDCPLCPSSFTKKKNLYSHLRVIHKVEPFTRREKLEFECKHCEKSFSHKASLIRHVRSFHVTNENDKRDDKKTRLICPHATCSEVFLHYPKLREHLSAIHCVEVDCEDLTFDSNEDFEDWKHEIEKISKIFYTQDSGTKVLKSGAIRLYLNCHHSYCYKPKGRNLRALKSSGSVKIGKACPSRLEVMIEENPNNTSTVYVKYWKTHYGHTLGIDSQVKSKRCIHRAQRKEELHIDGEVLESEMLSDAPEETLLNMDSTFKCSVCDKEYTKKKFLYTHLLNVHQVDTLQDKATEKFLCDTCGKNFLFKSSLILHAELHHGVMDENENDVEHEYRISHYEARKIRLACPNKTCNKQFLSYENLYKHLFDKHCIVVQCENLNFNSKQDFEIWKHEMEETTDSCYIKDSVKNKLMTGGNKMHLYCHHSHNFEPKGKIIPAMKSNGYYNVGTVCPSRLEVTMDENSDKNSTVSVKFWKTHYGHTEVFKRKENSNRCTHGVRRKKEFHANKLDSKMLCSVTDKDRLLTKDSPILCSVCHRIFRKKRNLYSHLINDHGTGSLQQKPSEKLLCDTCGKSFLFKSSLIMHSQVHHGILNVHEDVDQEDGKIWLICPHDTCSELLHNYENLQIHLSVKHCVEVQCEDLTFNSSEDFENWKHEMERNTESLYSKDTDIKQQEIGVFRMVLNCSHWSQGENSSRAMKSNETNKYVKACPSRLEVTIEENSKKNIISVEFWKTHYGHKQGVKRKEKSPTPQIRRRMNEDQPDLLDSEMFCSIENLMNTDDSVIIFSVSDDEFTKEKKIYLHNIEDMEQLQKEKPKFVCNQCGESFSRKSTLIQHIQQTHSSPIKELPKDKTINLHDIQEIKHLQHKAIPKFLCDACGESFMCKFTLIQHIFKTHQSLIDGFTQEKNVYSHNTQELSHLQQKSSPKFLCDTCGERFMCKSTLIQHIFKTHVDTSLTNTEHFQSEERNNKLMCPFDACGKELLSYEILRKHLSYKHGVEMQCDDLTFNSTGDFKNWKQEMQKNTDSLYTKDSDMKFKSGRRRIYFNCHNPHWVTRKGKSIGAIKSNGTDKISKMCPSRLEVTIEKGSNNDSTVSVKYWKTHCGHTRKTNLKSVRKIRKKRKEEEFYEQISDSEMFRSIIPVEKLIDKDKSIIKCSVCDRKFSKKKNLYTHLRSIHKIEPILQNETARFECNICGKKFLFKSSLIRHARVFHQICQSSDRSVRLICPEEGCNEEVLSYKKLREHLSDAHSFEVQCEALIFDSHEDFKNWKHQMEKNTNSLYTKDSGIMRLKSGEKRMYLNCHRSYYYKPKGRNLRALKSSGSIKIGKACPSRLEVSIKENSNKKSIVSVKYWKTHCGHVQEIIMKKRNRSCTYQIQREEEEEISTDEEFFEVYLEEEEMC